MDRRHQVIEQVPSQVRQASYDVYDWCAPVVDVSAARRRRLRRTARRRLLVIGPPWFRRMVHSVAPRDVAVVAACSPAQARELPPRAWDEVIVDAGTWERLRGDLRGVGGGAPVVAVPSADAERVRCFLRCPFGAVAGAVKRGWDVALALLFAAAAAPITALAAAAILLESGRPVLFTQTRIGAGGVPFRLVKLRTMARDAADHDAEHAAYFAAVVRGDAPRNAGLFKLVADERVTRVGALLRRFSIDELPQLWNVLRGEMSIVGPRPMMPAEADLLTVEQWARLRVRPGLTGAWQVAGRSALSFDEMVRLDVDYWQRWRPMTDVRILAGTPRAVLRTSTTA